MSHYSREICTNAFGYEIYAVCICMQNGLHLASPYAMLIYAFGILEFRQVLQWVPKDWSEKRYEISPSIYLSINQVTYLSSIYRPTHFWIDDGSMKHDLTTSQSRHGRHVWTMALLETSHALTVEKAICEEDLARILATNLPIPQPEPCPNVWMEPSTSRSFGDQKVGDSWWFIPKNFLSKRNSLRFGGSVISRGKQPPSVLDSGLLPKHTIFRLHASNINRAVSGFGGQTAPLHLGETLRFRWKTEFFSALKNGGKRILRISVFVGSDCAFIYRH